MNSWKPLDSLALRYRLESGTTLVPFPTICTTEFQSPATSQHSVTLSVIPPTRRELDYQEGAFPRKVDDKGTLSTSAQGSGQLHHGLLILSSPLSKAAKLSPSFSIVHTDRHIDLDNLRRRRKTGHISLPLLPLPREKLGRIHDRARKVDKISNLDTIHRINPFALCWIAGKRSLGPAFHNHGWFRVCWIETNRKTMQYHCTNDASDHMGRTKRFHKCYYAWPACTISNWLLLRGVSMARV